MERFLSTIFPCCFPIRRTSEAHERTPLLNDSSRSISDGTSAPSSVVGDSKRRKPTSILPSPAYDAQALKTILDDFKRKLIAVDASYTLVTPDAIQAKESTGHVTPIHTLQRAVTTASPTTAQTKLVDIWSPASPPTSSSSHNAILSYSAAVKRGAVPGSKKQNKRFAKGTAAKEAEVSVEQRTYETLAELATSKPLVHDWDLEDSAES